MPSLGEVASQIVRDIPRMAPVGAVIEAALKDGSDPLLALVNLYRKASIAFENSPEDDEQQAAWMAATYEPPLLALEYPPAPTTIEGAVAGLDFVLEELSAHVASPPCKAVVRVCVEFLRGQIARQPVRAPRWRVYASTDCTGGPAHARRYRQEWVECEPQIGFTSGLVVMAFCGGYPFLAHLSTRHRNRRGQFVPPGSPDEMVMIGPVVCSYQDIGSNVMILGRLVDQTRVFPKTKGL